MFENKLPSKSECRGPIRDSALHRLREALVNHEKNRKRRLIDDRCKEKVLVLFQEAQARSMDNVHTPTYKVVKQADVKALHRS